MQSTDGEQVSSVDCWKEYFTTDIIWNYLYGPLSPVATPKIGDGLRYLHAVIADLDHRYLHEDAQDSASDYGFS